jgi:hypothetical protein
MVIAVIAPLSVYAVPLPGTVTVEIDGVSHNIKYEQDGVEIIDVEPNLDDFSLIFEVKVTEPGLLRIDFERSFFDSLVDGDDDVFFVVIDGFDFIEPNEVETTSELRGLLFKLAPGSEEFEIFGTVLGGSTLKGTEVVEPPVVVEPPEVVEPPPVMEEKPKTQCGPGTVLKGGACVLDTTCGPGTHFEDGACVLDKKSGVSFSGSGSLGTEFMVGIMGALIISFIVMAILGLIGRGSRQKQTA